VSRWIAPAIAVAAAGWFALLVTGPALPVPLVGLLYAAGSLICHQLPERSFHYQEFQLPVCARCLGLYAGGAAGGVSAVGAALAARAALRIRSRYIVTVIAALPTIATFALEHGAGWRVSNTTRALAAVPLGMAVAFVVVSALATLHYDECAPRRPIGHGQPPANI
jgi:uncharacterized membrane protein